MTRDSHLAVIGLGYVGLPLAIAFAEAGLEVHGIDVSAKRVATLTARRSPIDDITDERLGRGPRRAASASRPWPMRTSTMSMPCSSASRRRSPRRRIPTSVRCSPRRRSSASTCGRASWWSSSRRPSRARRSDRSGPRSRRRACTPASTSTWRSRRSGSIRATRPAPRGPCRASSAGRRPAATARAAALLRHINDRVVELSSPDAAELAKLLENVFRNVNIALVNQLALLCERMGLDVWEVIGAAATKPFGFMKFTPGPGRRRPLHPGRPLLPRRGGLASSTSSTASSSSRATSTSRCRATSSTWSPRPSTTGAGRSRAPTSAWWAWPSSRTSRIDRNSPAADVLARPRGAGRRRPLPRPATSPSFRDARGIVRESVELPPLLDWADVLVIVTAHKAVDWTSVYERADLVVDTVDSSPGRATRAHQVLRLGAGWSTRS